jgi:hypothetical protein
MTTNWDKLSEDERREANERHRSGEYIRHKLIRFGYLSVVERRRLIEEYGDLEERFERGLDWETRLQIVLIAGCAYVIGLLCGMSLFEPGQSGWADLFGFAIAIITFCALALGYLYASSKDEKERNERFSEWRR